MSITDLGMAGITAGQSIVNQGLGMINQDRQAKINKEQAKYQQGLDKEMAKYTYDLTNTSALMKQLKANDLNPTLALGGGATGGQTVSTGNSVSYRDWETDRKSTRLNSSHRSLSRMPSSA